MERKRGPLENEVHELIRMKGLADSTILEVQVTGVGPSDHELLGTVQRFQFVLMEAIERVAREVDDLRARL